MPEASSEKAAAIRLNENDEIQQILGYPPGWMLRWGTVLVLLFVAGLLALGWVVKYPDSIYAEAILVTPQAPVRVVAPEGGRIDQLLVEEGQQVNEADLLVVFESSADWQAIQDLQTYLQRWQAEPEYVFRQAPPQGLALGAIQPLYADFSQKLKDYRFLAAQTSVASKIKALEMQQAQLTALNQSLERQKVLLEKEVALARKNYERDQQLIQENASIPVEAERAEADYLAAQRQLETLEGQMLNNQIRSQELELQRVALESERELMLSSSRFALSEDLQRLKSALAAWEAQYLLKAPISGRISMQQIRTPQQYVAPASDLLTILPSAGIDSVLAKANVPRQGYGKLAVGQKVQLQLDGYPHTEHGMLEGRLQGISPIPEDDGYLVHIQLQMPLITSYGHLIEFKQELSARARIIVAERRFLSRVFDSVLINH